MTLSFGKYKGLTIAEIANRDSSYVKWLELNIKDTAVQTAIKEYKIYLQEEIDFRNSLKSDAEKLNQIISICNNAIAGKKEKYEGNIFSSVDSFIKTFSENVEKMFYINNRKTNISFENWMEKHSDEISKNFVKKIDEKVRLYAM